MLLLLVIIYWTINHISICISWCSQRNVSTCRQVQCNSVDYHQIFKSTVGFYNEVGFFFSFFFQIQYLRRVLIAITGIHLLWEVSFSSLNRNLASCVHMLMAASVPWNVMHEKILCELLFLWQCNMEMSIAINHWNSMFCICGSFSKHWPGGFCSVAISHNMAKSQTMRIIHPG